MTQGDEPSEQSSLDGFLDAVAARQPTPGGGAVAAAAGALACSMARMVGAYSPGSEADPAASRSVMELRDQLKRADGILRGLAIEDGHAYTGLRKATIHLKNHPEHRSQYETALALAIAIPLELAGVACESLDLMERLLPVANRYLLSDLGVAAVVAHAAVRASSYMVSVNTASLTDPQAEQPQRQIDHFVARAGETLSRIETALR
ncbi:MAG: cyclodeaminase/cyclohydrolase family protein [Phycisphaerae bacterium]